MMLIWPPRLQGEAILLHVLLLAKVNIGKVSERSPVFQEDLQFVRFRLLLVVTVDDLVFFLYDLIISFVSVAFA